MAAQFKKQIEDYEESDLDSAVSLSIKISEIIVRDIEQEGDDLVIQ